MARQTPSWSVSMDRTLHREKTMSNVYFSILCRMGGCKEPHVVS